MEKNAVWYSDEESICWENNGKVIYWDEELYFLEFQGVTECFEPSYIRYDIITDNFPYPSIFTVCSGEVENREIYATLDYDELQNISNNTYADSHPQMFYGQFNSYYFNAIDIWQTSINENSILFMSQISIGFGGNKEYSGNNSTNNILKASPNPFKENLNIEYYNKKSVQSFIDIYSISGKKISSINTGTQKEGWNSYHWIPSNSQRNEMKEGRYLVVLKQGRETALQKIVYTN